MFQMNYSSFCINNFWNSSFRNQFSRTTTDNVYIQEFASIFSIFCALSCAWSCLFICIKLPALVISQDSFTSTKVNWLSSPRNAFWNDFTHSTCFCLLSLDVLFRLQPHPRTWMHPWALCPRRREPGLKSPPRSTQFAGKWTGTSAILFAPLQQGSGWCEFAGGGSLFLPDAAEAGAAGAAAASPGTAATAVATTPAAAATGAAATTAARAAGAD